jgi:hypothetical protein
LGEWVGRCVWCHIYVIYIMWGYCWVRIHKSGNKHREELRIPFYEETTVNYQAVFSFCAWWNGEFAICQRALQQNISNSTLHSFLIIALHSAWN